MLLFGDMFHILFHQLFRQFFHNHPTRVQTQALSKGHFQIIPNDFLLIILLILDNPEISQGEQTRSRRGAEVRLGVTALKTVVYSPPEGERLALRGVVSVLVEGRVPLLVQIS